MALIRCSECGNEVSNRASACPKCGNPIAGAADVRATGAPLTTIQATSKKYKAHQLGAVLLCCVGAVLIFAGQGAALWAVLCILLGLIWFLVARGAAWWHHG